MLANVKTVKQFVKSVTNMQGQSYYRRIWQDKNKRDNTLRNLAFRFGDATEANKVAEQLRFMLFTAGYTNKVVRTSAENNWATRSAGGEYVRVISAAD